MTHPTEGVLTFSCGIMKFAEGLGDERAAYDMVDTMLAPGTAILMLGNYGYDHSNMKTFEMVSSQQLGAVGLCDPKEVLASVVFFDSIPPGERKKQIGIFEAVKLADSA